MAFMAFKQKTRTDQIEGEITELLRQQREPAWPPAALEPEPEPEPEQYAPRQALPLPDYIEHRADINDIGRLSSQAVAAQFEASAKAIESMGVELIDVAKRAEHLAEQVKTAIAYVEETAQLYRDEAKIIFDRIQEASLLAAHVKDTCDQMRQRIEKPAVERITEEQLMRGLEDLVPASK